jgi:hypothetical protein
MTVAEVIALAGISIAIVAYAYARRTARKLAILEEMYWQLKFEHGELKARVDPPTPSTPEPRQTFVPLTRLRPPSPKATAGQQAPIEPGPARE